jgi:hypothetical protein
MNGPNKLEYLITLSWKGFKGKKSPSLLGPCGSSNEEQKPKRRDLKTSSLSQKMDQIHSQFLVS